MRSRTAMWLDRAASGALAASLLVLYWPSLRYLPISLDDGSQLALGAKQSLAEIFAADHYGHARPIKNALFRLFAYWPAWTLWRACSLGLLLAATALVQRLARRLTGSRAAGLATAALWALHPATASVTCWLSAANLALCLLGVLLYLESGARAVTAPAGPAGRRRLAIALLALVFALLGHELAIVAPALLWLQQWALARGSSSEPAARRMYLASGAAVLLFIAYALAIGEAHGRYRFSTEPAWSMSASAARYLFQNALLWLLPVDRFGVLLGDRPAEHLPASAVAWLALIGACFALWRLRDRDRALTFGIAWAVLTLAPVANFVPLGNTPLAMHYAYVPGVGLALALVRALSILIRRLARERAPALATCTLVLAAGAGAYLLPETARAIHAWGDAERLYATTAANYPGEVEPLVNLTAVYLDRRRYDLAGAALDRARALAPDDPGVVRNGFSLLWQTDRIPEALELLDRHPAVAGRPEFQLGRGQALARLGRSSEAAAVLRRVYDSRAPELDDEQRFAAGLHLLIALVQSEQRAEAERLLERLLQRYPEREELRSAAQVLRGHP